jgi:hypothetical protein
VIRQKAHGDNLLEIDATTALQCLEDSQHEKQNPRHEYIDPFMHFMLLSFFQEKKIQIPTEALKINTQTLI